MRYDLEQDKSHRDHRNTDHRGSNKHVRRVFCKDCGTVVDHVARSVHEALSTALQPRTEAERELIDRIADHSHLRKDQMIRALELMLQEVSQLEDSGKSHRLTSHQHVH